MCRTPGNDHNSEEVLANQLFDNPSTAQHSRRVDRQDPAVLVP